MSSVPAPMSATSGPVPERPAAIPETLPSIPRKPAPVLQLPSRMPDTSAPVSCPSAWMSGQSTAGVHLSRSGFRSPSPPLFAAPPPQKTAAPTVQVSTPILWQPRGLLKCRRRRFRCRRRGPEGRRRGAKYRLRCRGIQTDTASTGVDAFQGAAAPARGEAGTSDGCFSGKYFGKGRRAPDPAGVYFRPDPRTGPNRRQGCARLTTSSLAPD